MASRRGGISLSIGAVAMLLVMPLAADVHVAAAVSLQRPLLELSERQPMRLQWGGSVVLSHQLLQGAPAEIFATADGAEIDRLVAAGLVEASARCTLTGNRLVVVSAHGEPPVRDVEMLAAQRRVAVANAATAPLGRYTARALQRLGVELGDSAIPAAHARQTIEYVARGEVQAAIVYASDARRFADRVQVGFTLPAAVQPEIRYEAALLRRSAASDELFKTLCNSAALFERHGFSEWPGQP